MSERVRMLVVALTVAILVIVPLSRSAYAGWTANKCDVDSKYWCYSVYYTTYTGGVEIQTRWYWGGLGNGGATWWRRYITQDWRNASGTWTFLAGWAPGSTHTANGTEGITVWRDVANEGVVRMQNQFQATGAGNIWCDGYVDWHLTDTGNYWSMSSSPTCLTPQY